MITSVLLTRHSSRRAGNGVVQDRRPQAARRSIRHSSLRFAPGRMWQLCSEHLLSHPLRCGENQEFETDAPPGHCLNNQL